jgi:hypothetical protein
MPFAPIVCHPLRSFAFFFSPKPFSHTTWVRALFVALLCAPSTVAQDISASIHGSVLDETGGRNQRFSRLFVGLRAQQRHECQKFFR